MRTHKAWRGLQLGITWPDKAQRMATDRCQRVHCVQKHGQPGPEILVIIGRLAAIDYFAKAADLLQRLSAPCTA